MPGPLKNARHERFAQGLAKGETADAAYAAAGFKPNRHNAARLKPNEHIRNRVAELQGRAAEKTIVTVADIAQQLDEDREFARKLDHSAAAISATMGKAKVLGLLEDRTKVDITTAGQPLDLTAFYLQLPQPNLKLPAPEDGGN